MYIRFPDAETNSLPDIKIILFKNGIKIACLFSRDNDMLPVEVGGFFGNTRVEKMDSYLVLTEY